jgi:hypothetical protein
MRIERTEVAMDAIRPWLYVGKYRETLNASLLRAKGIDTMLELAEAIEYPGITSLYLPEGLSLLEAVQSLRKHHPESMPHPALWQSLCDYYHEEIPVPAMLRALLDYAS